MTTTTARPRTATVVTSPAAARVTQRRVLAAEGIKARSLRSTRWLVVSTVLSIVLAGVFPALGVLVADVPPAGTEGGAPDPTGGALTGVSFTQLLAAALGILVVTGEYTTGLVRSTFAAVPKRLPVLWAKAAVAGSVTVLAALVAVLVAFLTAQALLAAADVTVSLGSPGVLRAVVGSALVLGVTAVLGVALGALLRSAVGALAALFGLLVLLPVLGTFLPPVAPFLPSNAAAAVLQTGPVAGGLPPWAGLAVFALYAAAGLAGAAVALTRRDA